MTKDPDVEQEERDLGEMESNLVGDLTKEPDLKGRKEIVLGDYIGMLAETVADHGKEHDIGSYVEEL